MRTKKRASKKRSPAKKSPRKTKAPKPLGKVTHYFGKINVGIIKLAAPLAVGDTITVQGHKTEFTQRIDSMQLNHQSITKAKKGIEVGIRVLKRVHEGEKVFKAKKNPAVQPFITPMLSFSKPAQSQPAAAPARPQQPQPKTELPKKPGYGSTKFFNF